MTEKGIHVSIGEMWMNCLSIYLYKKNISAFFCLRSFSLNVFSIAPRLAADLSLWKPIPPWPCPFTAWWLNLPFYNWSSNILSPPLPFFSTEIALITCKLSSVAFSPLWYAKFWLYFGEEGDVSQLVSALSFHFVLQCVWGSPCSTEYATFWKSELLCDVNSNQ